VKKSEKEKFLKSFGSHLAELRRERNISQEQLSFDAEIDLSTLSKIERGVLNISTYNAFKISKALEIPFKEIFDFQIKL
jgi:transcriptional regulator with XRE-family HTH domain